jgi:hypothetical protein
MAKEFGISPERLATIRAEARKSPIRVNRTAAARSRRAAVARIKKQKRLNVPLLKAYYQSRLQKKGRKD